MKTKQLALVGFVVVMFVLYSLQQRHDGTNTVVAPSGQSATQSSGSGSAGTAASSGAATTNSSPSYKDGTYTGSVADAFYGNIQVQATVSGGKITNVVFLQYPNDRSNSVRINQIAMPYLKQEAIKAQSANVDIISGATDTSNAFIQSLGAALQKATTG